MLPAELVIGTPWVLLGLLALPALWWLLRMLPPRPLQTYFPALFLLKPLKVNEETPQYHPWWWLLLRLLLIALLIIAAADPHWQPPTEQEAAPLILVIDNSWANAPVWRTLQQHALDTLDTALEQGQAVYVVLTTPPAQGSALASSNAMTPSQMRHFVQSLSPLPWPKQAEGLAEQLPSGTGYRILWYSDGVQSHSVRPLQDALSKRGRINWQGVPQSFPLIVTKSQQKGGTLTLTLAASSVQQSDSPETVRFYNDQGMVILETPLQKGEDPAILTTTIPRSYWKSIQSFRVGQETRLGAFVLTPPVWSTSAIGIVDHTTDGDSVLAASYFVRNAVATFAEYQLGSAATLAKQDGGLIILPHDTPLAEADKQSLHAWVKAGGVLVRFAGESLAAAPNSDPLLPVALRPGIRQFQGDLTWEDAPTAAQIPVNSPLAGLRIPPDVQVSQQILAAPGLELPERTWLTLSDGTPLITARTEGEGWLILVHTTANPAWSSFAYSSLFIDFLERCQHLSHSTLPPASNAAGTRLSPYAVLDAYGNRIPPPPTVATLDPTAPVLSAQTPPGLYGSSGQVLLNFGEHLPDMQPLADTLTPLSNATRHLLGPYLLAAAFVLWCADYMLVLRLLALAGLLLLPMHAQAAGYADQGRLAYIRSGDPQLDAATASGLGRLTDVLAARTSVVFEAPLALDFSDPRLPLMPLLYWAWPETPPPLDAAAAEALNRYLTQQGMLVIDTRQGLNPLSLQHSEQAVAAHLKQLAVRPLMPLAPTHVLHRSFYILPQLTGRYDGQTLYIEQPDSSTGFVSRVLVMHHALADALAEDANGAPLYSLTGAASQREMAYRSGINIVLYALTGTYKDDQVHVETLLQQIGR